MIVVSDQPPQDLIDAREVREHYRIPYTLLRSWWARGRIEKYKRGDGRVFVRRSDIERMVDLTKRYKRVDP